MATTTPITKAMKGTTRNANIYKYRPLNIIQCKYMEVLQQESHEYLNCDGRPIDIKDCVF